MTTTAIIPARWGSTRFPGKPLAKISGKPMIAHVWDRAMEADGIDAVMVATDDERIAMAVEDFGGRVEMTRADHESGSDRLAEVTARIDAEVILNIQGDEPLVRPADLARLAKLMHDEPEVEVASLCHPISAEQANNTNRVKVVRSASGDALYFSRAVIPHPRETGHARYLQHAGIYAYRRAALLSFSALPVPAEERAECLEQLRFLAAGIPIRLIETEEGAPGVDTQEDIAEIERRMAAS